MAHTVIPKANVRDFKANYPLNIFHCLYQQSYDGTYYKYCRCGGTQEFGKYQIYVIIFKNDIIKIDKWTLNRYIY